MENTVKALRQNFLAGHTKGYRYRMEKLRQLRKSIQNRYPEILCALMRDLGKNETESYLTEIGMVLSEISHFEKHLRKWMRPIRVRQSLATLPSKNRIYPEPYGVCLILSPWNYPFQLALVPLIGAIAAGNVCVVRSSGKAKATAAVIRKIIEDCFSPDEVSTVSEDTDYADLMNPRYDLIFFTGSSATGKKIQKSAARHLTPVVLELGGKSPAIVDKTAHLPTAARRIVFGKLLNAGQTCVAPDHLLVEEKVQEALMEHLKEEFRRQLKNAVQNEDIPRIINHTEFDRLAAWIDAHPHRWGGWYDREHRLIQPAIFYHVTHADPVMREEIFGPILPVLSFTRFETMLQQQKEREKPLALYFFSRDRNRIKQVLHTLSFGGGCINDTVMHLSHPALPFGGVGHSGMGAYHGKTSFDTFSHKKSVLSSPVHISVPIRYRPYNTKQRKLIQMLLK